MYKQYLWVLQMDNTYNTNWKRMFLFQITVVIGFIANISLGLLWNEQEDWLLLDLPAQTAFGKFRFLRGPRTPKGITSPTFHNTETKP